MKDAAQAAFGAAAGTGVFYGGFTGLVGVLLTDDLAQHAAIASTALNGLIIVMPLAVLVLFARSRNAHPIGTTLGGLGGGVLGALLFIVGVAQMGRVFGGLDVMDTNPVVMETLGWGRLLATMGATALASAAAGFFFK